MILRNQFVRNKSKVDNFIIPKIDTPTPTLQIGTIGENRINIHRKKVALKEVDPPPQKRQKPKGKTTSKNER